MADTSTQPSVRILSPTNFPDKSAEELLAELAQINMAMLRALVLIVNTLADVNIEVEDLLGDD